MKITNRRFRTEPYTSAIDKLEEMAENKFVLKKGDKIAQITRVAPYFEIMVEIESPAFLIVNWCDRIAVIVEGKTVLNLGDHVYKTAGYKHDVVDEDDYKKMRGVIDYNTRNVSMPNKVDTILATLVKEGVAIIYNEG